MEPKICSVLDCGNRSDECDEEVFFYGFPRKPKYRKAWVAATGREQWSAKRSSRICSKHFLPGCFAEGEGRSLLEDAVPTEFINTVPPKERSSPPLTVVSEQHLEPDEIEEPVEWLEPGVNYPMELRNLLEDQADPNRIELRSTAVSILEPRTSSSPTEAELQRPFTISDIRPSQSSTGDAPRPQDLTAILSAGSPTLTRPTAGLPRRKRHYTPKSTKSAASRCNEGSESSILPPWVRILPEPPAQNPNEAGSTFRKKLFAFLRCPYNPLDIESDIRTLISLGVQIFVLRRGNFRAVVNSLFRYLMKA